ncbi:MAG TPA: TetR/AcrR family transcriptional regulator [Candidatus Binatia bacterium]|nr:TetR/AcrR family transcriptional regulator [Candidatus Binatia bacterium]
MAKALQRASRPRLAAAARRAQLVDVGRTVFAERGYEAASVEEIAARAGISKPIVYEHFGGKAGLYAAIVDREVEHIVGRIVEAISAGTARERLERAVLAFLAYVEERPRGFAVLLRDAPASRRSGEMPALMYDLAGRVGAIFADQFHRAGYSAAAAPVYAHALVGMVAFVGQWWTESRRPPAVETVASHVAALAWMGLRHLPRRPALLATPASRSRR